MVYIYIYINNEGLITAMCLYSTFFGIGDVQTADHLKSL
jgi:hypothetical protein